MAEIAKQPPNRLNVYDVVGAIAETPEYTRNRRIGYSTQRAFARTALELSGMDRRTKYEDEYELDTKTATRESALNAMVGSLDSFVYGYEGMRHNNTIEQQSRRAFHSFKKRMARFNHATKALIDSDPTVEFGSVSATILDLYGVFNRERWHSDAAGYKQEASDFKKQIEGVLRGMYQEVAAVRIIEALRENGTDNSVNPHVSAEEDKNGADLLVTLDGVTFPVDIKASARSVQSSRERSKHPHAIMTTGIPAPRSGDSFEISPDAARAVADRMLSNLYAARTEFLAAKSNQG